MPSLDLSRVCIDCGERFRRRAATGRIPRRCPPCNEMHYRLLHNDARNRYFMRHRVERVDCCEGMPWRVVGESCIHCGTKAGPELVERNVTGGWCSWGWV